MLLKFGIQNFIEDRELNNLSNRTMEIYQTTLANFSEWADRNRLENVEDIKLPHIKGYLAYLKNERGNGPTTLNDKLKVLRIFLNYFVSMEIIPKNPAKEQKYVKEDVKVQVFNDAQVKQMLNFYRSVKKRNQNQFWAYRDYMIIVTLMSSGLRVGELCNLKWKEIDWNTGMVLVWGKKREETYAPLAQRLKAELFDYLRYCKKYFGEENLNEYIFTNSQNQRLTDNAVKNIFKRLSVKMNFKDVRLSAHTFRHYFAKKCVLAGCDAVTLMKLLRHESIQMSLRYVELWTTDLKQQNEKFNPINEFNL